MKGDQKGVSSKEGSGGCSSRGSALIALIAAIAIFSVLAAALLAMTSTSARQTAQARLADQAYYLTESGYRYVTSQYLHPPTAIPDPNDVLENLDGVSVALDGNDGQFDLKVSSYFYEVTTPVSAAAAPTTNSLSVRTPGNFPDDEIDPTSLVGQDVLVNGETYTLTGVTGPTGGDQFIFTLNTNLQDAVDTQTLVYPVINASTTSPWNPTNRTIALSGPAAMFPARNGRIRVAGRTLVYGLKDETTSTFSDVQDIHGAGLSGFSVPSEAPIVLMPYIRVVATGIVGGDDTETRRTVSYYGALPGTEYSEAFTETFDNGDSILTVPSGSGTGLIGTISGDSNPVLQVTGTSGENVFLARLDVEGDAVAAAAVAAFNDIRQSTGGYLSYDAQTKVGFFDSGGSHANYIEHSDLAAGLSFRINPETVGGTSYNNMYGLSFLNVHGEPSLSADIIPPIAPDEPALVLWQQTIDAGAVDPADRVHRTWVAYKRLSSTLYSENFDTCVDMAGCGWTNERATGLWRIENNRLYADTYQIAIAQSPIIVIPDDGSDAFPIVTLSFYSSPQYVHPYDVVNYATRQVRIVHDGTTEFIDVAPPVYDSGMGMYRITADLSNFIGKEIRVQFYYDRASGVDWAVDNVTITSQSPIHNSTLMVRLKEAAAIPFNYAVSATESFETGDFVIGANSDAFGRVIGPPLMAAPASTQGWLLLNNVSDTAWFSTAEPLNIPGKGSIAAVDVAPDETRYRKANIIKVYYASAEGNTLAAPDPSSPLDVYTRPYERLSANQALQWPVADGVPWTTDRDYFRLIQWDGVNDDGSDADIEFVRTLRDTFFETIIDDAVILSRQAALQSPDVSLVSDAPELGLHAMGTDAAGHVYFDDFGFRLFYLREALFPPALQQ